MNIALVSEQAGAADRAARTASPLSVRGLPVSYGETPALFSADVTVRGVFGRTTGRAPWRAWNVSA